MNQRKLSVKHPSTENNLKFRFIWLGQTILKYQVPLDIFNTINGIYENNFSNLQKIANETFKNYKKNALNKTASLLINIMKDDKTK